MEAECCDTDIDMPQEAEAAAKPQHDPGFLQKLVASQRRQDAHWSSSDSSEESDDDDDEQMEHPLLEPDSNLVSNGISSIKQKMPGKYGELLFHNVASNSCKYLDEPHNINPLVS